MADFLDTTSGFKQTKAIEKPEIRFFLAIFILTGIGLGVGSGIADTLFLSHMGVEALPYIFIFSGIAFAVSALFYWAVRDWLRPEKLFNLLCILMMVVLALVWGSIALGIRGTSYPLLYMFYEVANSFLLIHLLYYIRSNLKASQLERIDSLINTGLPLGMLLGGIVLWAGSYQFNVSDMLVVALISCALAALITYRYHSKYGPSLFFGKPVNQNSTVQMFGKLRKGLALTLTSNFMLTFAGGILLVIMGSYVLKYLYSAIFLEYVSQENDLARLLGGLIVINSLLVLLFNRYLTPVILKRLGLRVVNLAYPLGLIGSFLLILLKTGLSSAIVASLAKDGLTKTMFNPAKSLIFKEIPASMQDRYRGVLLVLIYPMGMIAAGIILLFVSAYEGILPIIVAGLLITLLVLLAHFRENHLFHKEVIYTTGNELYLGRSRLSKYRHVPDGLYEQTLRGLKSDVHFITLEYARKMLEYFPDRAVETIMGEWGHYPILLKIELAELLLPHVDKSFNKELWNTFEDAQNSEERCAILMLLIDNADEQATAIATDYHDVEHPCEQALRIRQGLLFDHDRDDDDNPVDKLVNMLLADEESQHEALKILQDFPAIDVPADALLAVFSSTNENNRLDAMSLIPRVEGFEQDLKITQAVIQIVPMSSLKIKLAAISILEKQKNHESRRYLFKMLANSLRPRVRELSLRAWLSRGGSTSDLLDMLHANCLSFASQSSILDMGRVLFSRDEMFELVKTKVEQGLEVKAVLSRIPAVIKNKPKKQLIKILLEERLQQIVALSLSALACYDDRKSIQTIRAALTSKAPKFIEHALGALSSLSSQAFSAQIEALLRFVVSPQYRNGGEFPDQEAKKWCAEHGDPWVKSCLNHIRSGKMIDLFERILLLKKMSLFQEVYTEDLQLIAEAMEEDFFQKGDRVFDKGDPSDYCYVIHSGEVGVSINNDTTVKDFATTLKEGGYFGEMGVLDGHPRSATAHVLKDTHVLCISRKGFQDIIQLHPEISIAMLSRMNSIIREMTY